MGTFPALAGTPAWERVACRTPPPGHQLGGRQHRKENPHEDHHLDQVTPTPTTTTHRKENPHEDHHLDLSLMCVTGRRRRTAKTEAGADPITSARPVGYERSTAWASTNLIAATAMMPSAPQAAITTAGE